MIETLEAVEAIATPEKVVCLSGVVSLLEVLELEAKAFVSLSTMLREMETIGDVASKTAETLCEIDRHKISGMCEILADMCVDYAMPMSAKKANRICDEIKLNGNMLYSSAHVHLKELRERVEDELESSFFLHLEPAQAAMYQNPDKGWEVIGKRFNKIQFNIEESGKCFALERYGAAVFHVLQVAEYGVIQVAKLLKVEGDKPGWGSLKRLSDLIKEPFPKRTALAQQHTKLLENMVPLAVVIKDSWRHKLDHVDNQIIWVDTDFSPEVAAEIISATRAFMRKLAKELP
jgi:hypothetical protein